MAPIKISALNVNNISDSELSQLLKDYGVDVGPINAATRSTYERKLLKLQSETYPSPKKWEQSVDEDDDDDEETTYSQLNKDSRSSPYLSGSARSSMDQLRERQPTPRLDSHQTSNQKTMLNSPLFSKKSAPEPEPEECKSIPWWQILIPLVIAAVILFLIYLHMEATPESSIPAIQHKTGAK